MSTKFTSLCRLLFLTPGEEEEIIVSYGTNDGSSTPSAGASQQRRQHLISATKRLKEEEEGLSKFNCLGQAPQAVVGTSTGKVEVEAGAEVEVTPEESWSVATIMTSITVSPWSCRLNWIPFVRTYASTMPYL